MGKGAINEARASYGGTYSGISSHPDVRKAVETADAVLWIGNYPVGDLLTDDDSRD